MLISKQISLFTDQLLPNNLSFKQKKDDAPTGTHPFSFMTNGHDC